MTQNAAVLDGLNLPAELVTGEAVVLELRPASFATRSLAILLDFLILCIVGFVMVWTLVVTLPFLDEALGTAIAVVSSVLVLVGVPVGVETLSRGRSVGKLAAGLRVVRDDGGPIRFRHAFVRGLLALLEIYSLTFVGLIASLVDRRGRRLGDLLAGTYVIRERGGGGRLPMVVMPPELIGWAIGADIGRIPDRLSMVGRQFLGRADGLHPGSRHRLGVELANELSAFVAPMPPADVHPERFIAAVLAERSRRDLDRLRREQQLRWNRDERRRNAAVLSPTSTKLIGD